MDTEYKFAEHGPIDQSITSFIDWGKDNTRSYVGPNGWIISRGTKDKKWRMNHKYFKENLLTMTDKMCYQLEGTTGK